jgi:hypothetical protein
MRDRQIGVRKPRLGRVLNFTLSLAMLGSSILPLGGTAIAASDRPATPLDITTSPLPVTLSANPGQTLTTTIKMKQSSGDTATMNVTLLKFTAQGTSGNPALSTRGPGDTYFNWVSFDKTTFTAPNDVWQSIKMTIAVPKDAAFEYNYAVEFTRSGDTNTPGGNAAAIAGGSAVLVLLNVNAPGARRSVQLQSFSVAHWETEFLPVTFETDFHNNGNVYVEPLGDIIITQGNHQVGLVMVNDEQGNILGGTYRDYKVEWTDGFPYYNQREVKGKPSYDRHGNPVMVLNWNLPPNNPLVPGASTTNSDVSTESSNPLSRLRFGEYTARLVADYQDDYGRDVPITSTLNFWVIPWRILIGFLIILLVFGFAGYSFISGIMRRRRRLERLKRKRARRYYQN